MLGAQALRTKQKAEQKEKEKRHRERIQSVQLEREKMHRMAREEMNDLANEASLLQIRDQSDSRRGSIKHHHRSPSRSDDLSVPHQPSRHRHSVHNVNLLQPLQPKRRSIKLNEGPQRSTSTDYCRAEKKEGGNRFMRWLGFSSSSQAEKKEKRRMSTF
ncbi:hypothetical protein PMAYCL1PPCAC_11790 [Pristionchus mayeri]|uniref:Uncharacterized protein n=1 Tax=Pristionchus mayeri TaxID=1317129 RepID=A0AAN4ZR21_9BILA|nr:hypothetical protein PMAYCL1PPCAC_11790 [Pristionchus mayeri]